MSENNAQKPVKPTKYPIAGGKVFDVRRPGAAMPQTTSKPIIVGHKPQVRDSVIVKDRQSSPLPAAEVNRKVDIKPPEHNDKAADIPPELAAVAAELAQPDSSLPAKPDIPKPETNEVKKDEPEKGETAEPAENEEANPRPPEQEPKTDKIDVKPFFVAKPEANPEPVKKDVWAMDAKPPAAPEIPNVETSRKNETEDPLPLNEQVPGLEQAKEIGEKKLSDAAKGFNNSDLDFEESDSPAVNPKSVVVSKTGGMSAGKFLLWIFGVILCLVVIGDVLLDSGVIYSSVPIPHTHFFSK